MEQTLRHKTNRDGPIMSVAPLKERTALAARETAEEDDARKVRCLCGKWWAYRNGDSLVLRCKLCRRDIVVTGAGLKVTYR